MRDALAVTLGDADALRLKRREVEIEGGVEACRNMMARRQWKAARTAFGACSRAYDEESAVVPTGMQYREV